MAFCAKCGNTLAEGSYFCKSCGSPVSAPLPSVAPAAGAQQTSGKALASLVLGLFFFLPPSAIAAIVLGHISLSQIRKSAGRLKGDGLAIAGLVLGYMGLVAIPFILIVAAIAIPNLLRARIAANEASAVGAVRLLNTAEITYQAAHPDAGFTCSLSDLGQLLDPRLANGEKNGYAFRLVACSAETSGGPNTKYQILALPLAHDQSGVRAFCSDESAVIKVDGSGSPQACLENGSALQ